MSEPACYATQNSRENPFPEHVMKKAFLAVLIGIGCLFATACREQTAAPIDYSGPVAEWTAFGANEGGGHFSPATQITRAS